MPRRVPGVPRPGAVAAQRPEKRRQQGLEIVLDRLQHLSGQKGHAVLEQVENAAPLAQLTEGFRRCLLQGQLLAQREQRQMRSPLAGTVQQRAHGLQAGRIAAGILGAQQDRRQPVLGAGNQLPLGQLRRSQHRLTALLEGGNQLTQTHTSKAIGMQLGMNQQQGKSKIVMHDGYLSTPGHASG